MDDKSGTASYTKGEPTATDAGRLRRAFTDEQKTELRQIIGARLRAFRPGQHRG